MITVTYNSSATIADCLTSVTVASQTWPCEHIIIDGASKDNTVEIVRRVSPSGRIFSEPDDGIYDAMNKGIRLATGNIVGILNSDDFYAGPHVLKKVMTLFRQSGVDALFADLVYVRSDNLERVVRYYSGSALLRKSFPGGGCRPIRPFSSGVSCMSAMACSIPIIR